MMFRILILQRYYNLSDDNTDYAILHRLSFMRFLDWESTILFRMHKQYGCLGIRFLLAGWWIDFSVY